MSTERALDVINEQQWLEPVADALQKGVHAAYSSAGAPGQAAKNAMHGVWLGHPLHPVLTDIPLGCWSMALVSDVLELATGSKKFGHAADIAIGYGLAGALGAAVTGLTDWSDTDGRARKIGLTHGLLNLTGAGLYGLSLAWRLQGKRGRARTIAALAFAGATVSAWLGGNMVYAEQIGVNRDAGGPPLPKDWTATVRESELAEGQMKRVEAKGWGVLLTRQNGQIAAVAERCTHAAGPLSEGKLSGGEVTCPWHASRFNVKTGEVLDGPATHPLPCFQTRVTNGMIEIRSAEGC